MSKKLIFILIVLIVLIIASFTYSYWIIKNTAAESSAFQTKTSESTVTIELTPKRFDGKDFLVEISVNTHTVDLSQFDLKKLTFLVFNGKSISPISSPQLNGHHDSGTIVFETNEKPENFKIKILRIPDLQERVFEW